jgi:uncharacterized membrane protein YphA (DoxX/SURF4 family)
MMQSAPFNFRRAFILIGRLVLAGIFLFAGLSKIFYPNHFLLWPLPMLKLTILMNLSAFGAQVNSYRMLSEAGVAFVSHTLPFFEVTLGLLLLIGWQVRIWVTLTSLLLLSFFTVLTRSYLLHLQIDCGCFGKPEPLTGWTLVRDGSILLLAILVSYFAFRESRKPHPWSAPQTVTSAST